MKRCGKSAPARLVTDAARQTPRGARPNRETLLWAARSKCPKQFGRRFRVGRLSCLATNSLDE